MMSCDPSRLLPRSSPLSVIRPTTPASLRDGSRPSLGVGGASVAGAAVAGASVAGAAVGGGAVGGATVAGGEVTTGAWVAIGAVGAGVATGCGVLVAAGTVVTHAVARASTRKDRPNERSCLTECSDHVAASVNRAGRTAILGRIATLGRRWTFAIF